MYLAAARLIIEKHDRFSGSGLRPLYFIVSIEGRKATARRIISCGCWRPRY
ncbi:hypothetical protein [Ensifer canadensis]